ncbi:uncharacterized protein K02A2.6-like [Aplysia californica]|uniref:Uncharacterized protein K02A2.6-like n=1 Tax=Aplysia californica TaxID=6500 RepID=A0ABM0K0Y5_APLCA|nr:uncharacterized protein K02A2.6-like [Aplysia californica]
MSCLVLQRRYGQIQMEALAIIFGLNKFHQFLYGRRFILVTDHKPLIVLFGPTKPIPSLSANGLARWVLTLSQYDYSIEYRKASAHGNADALRRLPVGADPSFDREETGADSATICTIKRISSQIAPADPNVLERETSKDPAHTKVIQHLQGNWPKNFSDQLKPFYVLRDSLSLANGCIFHSHRVVIPKTMQSQVLQILHLGHFGMQRIEQLARTAVYWPSIDADIENVARHCTACNEHQRLPPKPSHPRIIPDEPWSCVHIDHAINFRGHNWLVMVDAFSKYPCIYLMSSITTKTFKQFLKKSDLPPAHTLQEFLMHYRRTPLASGSRSSELLDGRQIRTKLDVIISAQRQTTPRVRDEPVPARRLSKDSPCFALSYEGGRRDRWKPAVATAFLGHKLHEVRVLPDGPMWRRHGDQLCPRHALHQP